MSVALERGLYSVLVAAATTAGSRVHPHFEQGIQFPAIRYTRITTTRNRVLSADGGMAEAVMQLDCMARTYGASKVLADEVRDAIEEYSGSWGTLRARNVVLETESDLSEIEGDDKTFWIMQRYRIYTDMD